MGYKTTSPPKVPLPSLHKLILHPRKTPCATYTRCASMIRYDGATSRGEGWVQEKRYSSRYYAIADNTQQEARASVFFLTPIPEAVPSFVTRTGSCERTAEHSIQAQADDAQQYPVLFRYKRKRYGTQKEKRSAQACCRINHTSWFHSTVFAQTISPPASGARGCRNACPEGTIPPCACGTGSHKISQTSLPRA